MRDFGKELNDIVEDNIKESDEVIKRLKAEGKWPSGLDGYCPELEAVKKKHKARYEKVRQEFREVYARGEECMFNGKIHNTKQKTDENE